MSAPPTTAMDDEIPDDLFATLPDGASQPLARIEAIPMRRAEAEAANESANETENENEARVDPDDILASLPELPSLDGLVEKLAIVQAALDEARAEADALREELREKAEALRGIAAALEAI